MSERRQQPPFAHCQRKPACGLLERAGQTLGDAVGRVGDGDVRVFDRHRRAARRLEGRRQLERELSLPVLDREVARGVGLSPRIHTRQTPKCPRRTAKQHRSDGERRVVGQSERGLRAARRAHPDERSARSRKTSLLRALAGSRPLRGCSRALAAVASTVAAVGRRRRVRKRRCCGGREGCAREQNCSELACLGHVHLPPWGVAYMPMRHPKRMFENVHFGRKACAGLPSGEL
jgi:hypothetical protein